MITLLVVLLIATAIRRGYRQGAPRELIDLIVVVVGIPIAFRTGAPIGEWLFGDRAPLASRTLGALVVFGGISLIALAPRRALGHAPLDVGERQLGAAIGAIRSSIVSVIIVAVVAAVPATSTLGAMAQRSRVVAAISDPNGAIMTLFQAITGEDGMVALITFNRAFPDGPAVGDETLRIPSFRSDELSVLRSEGIEILDLVNGERVAAGVAQLSWSSALADVAIDYADEMYVGGFFSHVSPRTGGVGSRLGAAGITYALAGENLALAPNVAAVHSGLMTSPGHRANILTPEFTHVGIGVVQGPIGLIVVQVFFRA